MYVLQLTLGRTDMAAESLKPLIKFIFNRLIARVIIPLTTQLPPIQPPLHPATYACHCITHRWFPKRL